MRQITFAGTITVSDGPVITVNPPPLSVEVGELSQLTLAKDESKTVSFGGANAPLEFLALTGSTAGLRCAVNAAAVDDAKSPMLEYPLILLGESVIWPPNRPIEAARNQCRHARGRRHPL